MIGVFFAERFAREGRCFREISRREKERQKEEKKKKKKETRATYARSPHNIGARFVLARGEREELRARVGLVSPSITSCLPRCRTGRGVLVSQRFSPWYGGDGEVGGIVPTTTICAGSVRVPALRNLGHPRRSALSFRFVRSYAVRMEPFVLSGDRTDE